MPTNHDKSMSQQRHDVMCALNLALLSKKHINCALLPANGRKSHDIRIEPYKNISHTEFNFAKQCTFPDALFLAMLGLEYLSSSVRNSFVFFRLLKQVRIPKSHSGEDVRTYSEVPSFISSRHFAQSHGPESQVTQQDGHQNPLPFSSVLQRQLHVVQYGHDSCPRN